jgi:tRNA(fMet)-specific endonuclease VapC
MSARFLLDTNICIYWRQKRPPQVIERFRKLQPGEAVLSVVTYGELVYGVERSAQRVRAQEALSRMISLLPVLPLPEDAGVAYGEIRAALEAQGRMIGGNDLWIAAHAKASGLVLVTNNEREFRRVPGLKIQNWVD